MVGAKSAPYRCLAASLLVARAVAGLAHAAFAPGAVVSVAVPLRQDFLVAARCLARSFVAHCFRCSSPCVGADRPREPKRPVWHGKTDEATTRDRNRRG